MQNLRHWKEIKIHFFLIHVLVCLTVYEVNISLFNKFNRTFLCFPPPTHPTPNSLPGFQVIGDGQIFVIRVKIVLKEMGGEKSPSHAYMEVAHYQVKPLFIFFFHLNLFYVRRWKVVTTNHLISKVLKYVTVSMINYFVTT